MPSKCTIVESKAPRAQAAEGRRGGLQAERRQADRSISFCALDIRKRPRRRPKSVDNHIIND
jgi:hypothetical protein